METSTRERTAASATPVAVLAGGALLVLSQLYATIPLTAPVGAAFGGGNVSAALGTAFALAYAVGFLFFGPLSDHYGRLRVLVPGMAVLALATAALTVAPSLEVMALLRAVQGFAASCFAPIALAYLMEALPPRRSAAAIGVMSTAFLVAGILGQVYASSVALAWGWEWVFGLAGAALAVVVVLMRTLLREPSRDVAPGTLGGRFAQMARLLGRRRIVLPAVAHLGTLLAFVAMYSALGPHLGAEFGLDEGDIIWVRLAGLPGMLIAPYAGTLVARFGATRMAVAGFTIAALGAGAEALAGGSLWLLTLTTVVFVAGIATVIPAMITLFGERALPARAAGVALNGFVLFAGASLGPLVPLLGWGFGPLMLALAGCLLVSAALVLVSAPAE